MLQCNAINDAAHILLTKTTVDKCRAEYIASGETRKSVFILIHLQRGMKNSEKWQLNFMCGWKQLSVDNLEHPKIPLTKVLGGSVVQLIDSVIFVIVLNH